MRQTMLVFLQFGLIAFLSRTTIIPVAMISGPRHRVSRSRGVISMHGPAAYSDWSSRSWSANLSGSFGGDAFEDALVVGEVG